MEGVNAASRNSDEKRDLQGRLKGKNVDLSWPQPLEKTGIPSPKTNPHSPLKKELGRARGVRTVSPANGTLN